MDEVHTQPTSTESVHVPDGDSHTLVVPPRNSSPPVQPVIYEGTRVTDTAIALLVAFALTGVVVSSALGTWRTAPEVSSASAQAVPVVAVSEPHFPTGPRPYDSLRLEAKSVAVYDVYQDKFLYTRSADVVRPLASLTKLMTGLIAYENANADQPVRISAHAITTEGDSGLFANETWRLGDLLSFTLVTSSNDGADAIAASVGSVWDLDHNSTDKVKVDQFVKSMNRRAQELGMKDTEFSNPSGLDDVNGSYGGLGSARDVAHLVAYIWEHVPQELSDTTVPERTYISEDGFEHSATNTNTRISAIQGALGSKTGYTDSAGGNLTVVYDAGMDHPVVVVVLGSSREGRFSDVESLVRATNEYVTNGWYAYEVAGSTPLR